MKNFNELSGPWTGWSIQDAIRIGEVMRLQILRGSISGSGSDRDGDFELMGFYNSRTQVVTLTRRYTRTNEPSLGGAGIPYDYEGIWDGMMVSGTWHPRFEEDYGGPFEMWPDREVDRQELAIESIHAVFQR